MNNILDLLQSNNITLHLISKGDKYCEANGEENYTNSSYSAINDIWLGIYDNPELKNLSLCHEIAHCLIERTEDIDNVYELEKLAWNNTFEIAKDCDILLSNEAVEWGNSQLKEYEKFQ